ncbi:MAG: hypothetical protein AAGA65_13495 [Actinomycetota bacterium]
MAQFSCVVQERGIAVGRQAELEQRLTAHHVDHFPGEETSVNWTVVPHGYMFTEGRTSTSSIISCSVTGTTTRDFRETYMRGVCDLWSEITGCTDHEIVVSMNESATG